MPIFDYECQECNFTKEKIVSFSEKSETLHQCPACDRVTFKKVEKIYKSSWVAGKSFHNGGYVSN